MVALAAILFSCSRTAVAGVTFGYEFGSPQWRWDNASLVHLGTPDGDIERSLAGGLRYSIEGGSFSSYYSLFSWDVAPTEVEFEQAVTNAFSHWTSVDPVSGFGTSISFVQDFGTAVNSGTSSGAFENLRLGSEIDLFANSELGAGSGFAQVSALGTQVELTSGVSGYSSFAISGADIFLSASQLTVQDFELLLTHELGHALGLADVELADGTAIFLDDNFDGTNNSTALATLMNSWADLVNPLDPDNIAGSGLSLYSVANGDPGLDTAGVAILMESDDAGGFPIGLKNDDYAMRQFLYPQLAAVPEPSSLAALSILAAGFAAARLRRRKAVS
ncbi:MAG: PEP-CTERM sorting domain-containing protein [Planctomycetaceae bacterium]